MKDSSASGARKTSWVSGIWRISLCGWVEHGHGEVSGLSVSKKKEGQRDRRGVEECWRERQGESTAEQRPEGKRSGSGIHGGARWEARRARETKTGKSLTTWKRPSRERGRSTSLLVSAAQ